MKRFAMTLAILIALFAVGNVQAKEVTCKKDDPCKTIKVRNEREFAPPTGNSFLSKKTYDICIFNFEEVEGDEFFSTFAYREDISADECAAAGKLNGFWTTFHDSESKKEAGMFFGIYVDGEWKYFSYLPTYGPIGSFLFPEVVVTTTTKTEVKQIPPEIPYMIEGEFRRATKVEKPEEADLFVVTEGFEQPQWTKGCVWTNYPGPERIEGEWVVRDFKVVKKDKCSGGIPTEVVLLKKPDSNLADGIAIRYKHLVDGKKKYSIYFKIEYETSVEIKREGEPKPKTTDKVVEELSKTSPASVQEAPAVSTLPSAEKPADASCSAGKPAEISQDDIEKAAAKKAEELYLQKAKDLEQRAMEKAHVEKISSQNGIEAVVKNTRKQSATLGSENKTTVEEVRTNLLSMKLCSLSADRDCVPTVEVEWKKTKYYPDLCAEVIRFQRGKNDSDVNFLNSWKDRFCRGQ